MNNLKLSEMELQQLKGFSIKREEYTYLIGKNTLKFLTEALGILSEVQKLQQEQDSLGKILIRSKGCDMSNANYSIDFQTGEITKVE